MNSKYGLSVIRIIAILLVVAGFILYYCGFRWGEISVFAGIIFLLLDTLPSLFRNKQNIKVFYNKDSAERVKGRVKRFASVCLIISFFAAFLWVFDPKAISHMIPSFGILLVFSFLQPNFSNAMLLLEATGLYIVFRQEKIFLAWENVESIKFSSGPNYIIPQRPNMDIVMKDGNIYKLVLVSSRWHNFVRREDEVTEQLNDLLEASKIPIWINGVRYSLS